MKTSQYLKIALLATAVLFSACKKDEIGSDNSKAFKQLGEIQMDDWSVGFHCFNAKGDPMGWYNNSTYEWAPEENNYRRVGSNNIPYPVRTFAQDPQGKYYATTIYPTTEVSYVCDNRNADWVALRILGNSRPSPWYIFPNGNGDIVAITREFNPNTLADTVYYHVKEAASPVWTLKAKIPYDHATFHRPIYFTNNGNVIFEDKDTYNGIHEYAVSTNTGQRVLLFDKAAPANIPLVFGDQLLGNRSFYPNGDIYIIDNDDHQLYYLNDRNLPAVAQKKGRFTNIPKDDDSWTSKILTFTIEPAGKVRAMSVCEKGTIRHSAAVTGKVDNLTFFQHPLNSSSLTYNFNGDVFIKVNNGYYYEW